MLCNTHHTFAHDNKWYAEKWRDLHKEAYGEYYFMDEWDLYRLGWIEEPTPEAYEAYMVEHQKNMNSGGFKHE